MMDIKHVVVFITVPDQESADRVSVLLVEKKLAACVNQVPGVQSVYRWQGEVNRDSEILLIAKTRASLFEEAFAPAVKEVHPYDLPEIIALPVLMGSQDYLDWIDAETG